jgi:GT2 family glycosyltransferase
MADVSLNFAAAAELHGGDNVRDLDIGVIYTHERHFMPPLLTTLAASGPGLRMRLWLIDNQSEDGAEQWTPLFPETRILQNDRRLNYAENLNRVLEVSRARYVLLLNTDMYLDPADQCLARMVAFMDAHPECGLASCRLVHPDGEEAHAGRRFQTLGVIAARRLGLGRAGQGMIDRYLCLDQQASEAHECDWVSGCFLLLRREASGQVGLFDTRFGKYFEDVDMALRIGRAGWTVMQNRATKCFHWEQRASARVWSRDAWRHLRAYAIWLRKWGWSPGRGVQRVRAARRRAA